MKRKFWLALLAGILGVVSFSVSASECQCVHAVLDKDGGSTLEGKHDIDCSNFTHNDVAVLDSGAMFEKTVLQHIAKQVAGGSNRILVRPSTREILWDDKDGSLKSCVVPDIAKRGEFQPARAASISSPIITFSLAGVSAEYVAPARLAANSWNIQLAAAKKKTRFLEVASSSNATVTVLSGNLSKALRTSSYDDVTGVTWTIDKNFSSHPEWPVPLSAVILNTAFASLYKTDGMIPTQTFGHEFGHVLGLADAKGTGQLMSGAVLYTSSGELVTAMEPDDYTPNVCEIAKLIDNGIP